MKQILFLFIFLTINSFSQTETYEISNLDINDSNSHYGLVLYQNNKVFFSSPIMNKENLRLKAKKKHLIYSLFEGTKSLDGQITDIIKLDLKDEGRFNLSSAVVSPDGKYIYITANYSGKKHTFKSNYKNFNLYIAKGEFIKGQGWTNFEILPFCKPKFSFGHPAISPDGNTLYFVANLPSSKGPSDIFRVSILENNEYGKPINLGQLVNSVRKETFPFISKEGILYFSSNRANGFGGLDLYSAKLKTDDTFEEAKILPKPLNSRADDFCFTFDSDKKEGYFSSKRPGGKGDDDIYYFKISNDSKSIQASESN